MAFRPRTGELASHLTTPGQVRMFAHPRAASHLLACAALPRVASGATGTPFAAPDAVALLVLAAVLAVALAFAAAVASRRRLAAERARADRALARLRHLGTLAVEFSAARTPATVAEVAFRACRAAGATHARIAWLAADGGTLEILFTSGHELLAGGAGTLPLDAGLPTAVAVREGQPVFLSSRAEAAARFPAAAELASEVGAEAWIAWPLVLRARPMGALGIGFGRPGPLAPADLELIASVAELTAQALERARLQERAVESERRFRLLAENAPDVVFRFRLGAEAGFEYVSPAATALLGYTPEEHYADPGLVRRLVFPEDLPALEAAARAPGSAPLLLRWRRRDGAVIWTEQRLVLLRDEAGTPVALEGIARDVTERVAVQAERERLVSEREDLLRAVSHDFRTPLQAVLLRAEGLVRNPGDPERVARNGRSIAESARRLSAAVQDVVHLARLSAGALEPQRRAIPLASFVHELAQRLFSEEAFARLELQLGDGVVIADPDHLERIVTNLVDNALKYSPATAPVRIACEPAPDGAARVLSVADQGPGILPQDLPQLFQRYFRGSRQTGREGTGLGLFVTRMLAEAQGGSVTVETELGRGSIFRVRLPSA